MLNVLLLLLLLDLSRSAAGVDVVPTFTTSNARICLLLSNGKYGALRIEDAERLQVCVCVWGGAADAGEGGACSTLGRTRAAKSGVVQ
jgi:hypothetical protein